ncbi:MAG: UDP-N-acetylglucosamine 1-carboxyvinyltransferase [Patescibacteria group bacterium]|nr:UDP-N-acetylglucosamine 1-carboxyvinyltransferase [Patescibacteria group bacterium]
MEKFVIKGGNSLKGEIAVGGAKNAAFPLLASSILTKEDVIIENLPLIEDVFRIIEILEGMGAKAEWIDKRTIKLNTKKLDPKKIDKDIVELLRGSVLLFGPLLARFGKVYLPQPGGCVIGARPIDTHLDAFSQLGVKVKPMKDGFELSLKKKPKEVEVILNEFSPTATENILLFASLMPGPITIKTADQDYQVQELVTVLKKMGVKVSMKGAHTLVIKGKATLKGYKHKLMYDPIEAGTFIIMGAATLGTITVKNCELDFLELLLKRLADFGVQFDITKRQGRRGDVTMYESGDIKIDKIQTLIFPGLASDFQSAFGVLATKSPGSTLLHDPMYEGRLKYLEELNKMGAEIYFTDPHRAIINGPTQLYGTDLGTYDLRGGAALIIAALIARGTSTIKNIYQVDRGYERIEERLQKLGADIQRVS